MGKQNTGRCQGGVCTEERLSEATAKRPPPPSREERPQQKPAPRTLWSLMFNLQNGKDVNFCWANQSVDFCHGSLRSLTHSLSWAQTISYSLPAFTPWECQSGPSDFLQTAENHGMKPLLTCQRTCLINCVQDSCPRISLALCYVRVLTSPFPLLPHICPWSFCLRRVRQGSEGNR